VEGDRKIIEVEDHDTTYRVQSRRIQDLKARALAAYFPPEKVKFRAGATSQNWALALAYIDARTVEDRLDYVLGPDGWQTTYDHVGKESVRCTLSVRFVDGGEWITKCDVGSTSDQSDEGDRIKSAYSDALKRAAVQFGVGRYLYSLPQIWVGYDAQKKRLTETPQLPVNCVPSAYLPAGAEKMGKVKALLVACLEKAKIDKGQWNPASCALFADYGYKGDPREEMPKVQKRHAELMLQRLNRWVGEIADGSANHPSSPLYNPNPAPPTGKSETKATQQTATA
jgi:hypothetical protein